MKRSRGFKMGMICLGLWVSSVTGAGERLWNGGDSAGNGDSIAENNVLFAFHSLEQSIRTCLSSLNCGLQGLDRELLYRIYSNLPFEYRNPKAIEFLPNSDFFVIDGRLKLARTRSFVGATIFVNKDLMDVYLRASADSVNIESMTSVMIHELGHHQGIDGRQENETWLDSVGAKVGAMLHSKISRIDLGPGRRNIQSVLIDSDSKQGTPALQIVDGLVGIDVGARIAGQVTCPTEANGMAMQRTGFSLYNVHWIFKPSQAGLVLKASGVTYCSGATESKVFDGWGIRAELETVIDETGALRFQKDRLEIKLEETKQNGGWKQ